MAGSVPHGAGVSWDGDATGESLLVGERCSAVQTDADKCIGVVVWAARWRVGLSQAKLARRLNRCQSYVAKIEGGMRGVGVRELFWIFSRLGVDPFPVLVQLFRDHSFRDLQDRPKRRDRRMSEAPYVFEAYREEDETPDDDETQLGHLRFDRGGAV